MQFVIASVLRSERHVETPDARFRATTQVHEDRARGLDRGTESVRLLAGPRPSPGRHRAKTDRAMRTLRPPRFALRST